MAQQNERTFLMIKPDGVQRSLIGSIISRFETRGYKLAGLKMVQPPKEILEEHYSEHKARPFFPGLVSYVGSGPVVAMIWEGSNVVKASRKMIGETKPVESAPGTIRGDYAIDVGRNLIHGSDSVETAQREICLWFPEKEYCPYKKSDEPWIYENKN